MLKIIILKGIPASGKSTFAIEFIRENENFRRVNRDELRKMHNGYKLEDKNEKFIKRLRDWIIMETLIEGHSVIVDDTNISPKNEKRITDIAREFTKKTGIKVEVEVKIFDIELEEAIHRDAQRTQPVGSKQIKAMHSALHGTKTDRNPHYNFQDSTLESCIVCDLDGTLAILNGRSPFDASTCEQDLLNEPIAEILKTYAHKGDKIILLSGRMDEHREQTIRWLQKHSIHFDQLLMRMTEDIRKDAIIKKEIIENHIWGKYNIRFVLDDRNQVVDMWRQELGVACLQVYYGDF